MAASTAGRRRFRLGAPQTHVPLAELVRLTGAWFRANVEALGAEARAERRYVLARQALVDDATKVALDGEERWHAVASPYGRGLDERVVEYPWVFSRIGTGRRLLDVGSTLNQPAHLARLAGRFEEIAFLNPHRDDGYRSPLERVSYVWSDVRSHWLRAGSFDRITCISTLEHVGCDNSRYGGPAREAREADTRRARGDAMRAMRELLAPGGSLLLTMPFGRHEEHDWFVQPDADRLAHAIDAFAPRAARMRYFLHDAGWREVDASACASAAYGTQTRGAGAVVCAELGA